MLQPVEYLQQYCSVLIRELASWHSRSCRTSETSTWRPGGGCKPYSNASKRDWIEPRARQCVYWAVSLFKAVAATLCFRRVSYFWAFSRPDWCSLIDLMWFKAQIACSSELRVSRQSSFGMLQRSAGVQGQDVNGVQRCIAADLMRCIVTELLSRKRCFKKALHTSWFYPLHGSDPVSPAETWSARSASCAAAGSHAGLRASEVAVSARAAAVCDGSCVCDQVCWLLWLYQVSLLLVNLATLLLPGEDTIAAWAVRFLTTIQLIHLARVMCPCAVLCCAKCTQFGTTFRNIWRR